MVNGNITFDDYLGLQQCLVEWADSYDSKNWDRLRKCIAPTLRIDYRSFLDKIWEAMPAEEFIAMISDESVLGDPLLMTQHFIGGTKWEKVSDTEVIGVHQLRVPHQRYTDETRTKVAVKGHAHSTNTHWYRKVDGEWKFAGLNPEIRWGEFDFDKVFASGREAFGDELRAEDAKAEGIPAKMQERIPFSSPLQQPTAHITQPVNMAIIDGAKGLEATIKVNGKALDEYDNPVPSAPAEGTNPLPALESSILDVKNIPHVVKYVESVAGAEFQLCFTKKGSFRSQSDHIAFQVEVDGKGQALCHEPKGPRGRRWDEFIDGVYWGSKDDGFLSSNFKFAHLNIVDSSNSSAEEMEQEIEESRNLGTLRIYVYHMMSTNEICNLGGSEMPTEINGATEKATKGLAVTHIVQLGEDEEWFPEDSPEDVYEDPSERPFAVFEFRYRSKEGLMQEGVIPRLDSIDEMDEQEVRAFARRLQERQEAAEFRIKREPKKASIETELPAGRKRASIAGAEPPPKRYKESIRHDGKASLPNENIKTFETLDTYSATTLIQSAIMAILDEVPGLEATIQVNGVDLEEYDNPHYETVSNMPEYASQLHIEPRLRTKHVIKYIETKSGDFFAIKFTRRPEFHYVSHHIAWKVNIDNEPQSFLHEDLELKAKGQPYTRIVDHTLWRRSREENWNRGCFQFADLGVAHGEHFLEKVEQDKEILKRLGVIKVSIFNMLSSTKVRAGNTLVLGAIGSDREIGEMAEKSLVGSTISQLSNQQAVRVMGNDNEDDPNREINKSRCIDFENRPFAVFEFRYRSTEGLIQEGISPYPRRWPPPAHPSDSSRLLSFDLPPMQIQGSQVMFRERKRGRDRSPEKKGTR
ncbi:scytalone dehydratase [Seiridium cupressi]